MHKLLFLYGRIIILTLLLLADCSPASPNPTKRLLTPTFVQTEQQKPSQLDGFIIPDWRTVTIPSTCKVTKVARNLQWALLACRELGESNLWLSKIENNECKKITRIDGLANLYQLAFSYDSKTLIYIFENKWEASQIETPLDYLNYQSAEIRAAPLPMTGWSPDGKMFAGYGDKCGEITIKSQKNSEGISINTGDCTPYSRKFSWTPDSKKIAFVTGDYTDAASKMRVYTIDVETQERQEIFHGQLINGASWSPDGKWIAVREKHFLDIGTDESLTIVWLINHSNKDQSPIKLEYQLGGFDIYNGWGDLIWSPDGSMIALYGGPLIIRVPTGEIVSDANTPKGTVLGWDDESRWLLIKELSSDFNDEVLRITKIAGE